MQNKIFKIFLFSFILFSFIFPSIVGAVTYPEEGLVPCGKGSIVIDSSGNVIEGDPCDFYDFLRLINIIVNFVLFRLAIPVAAIVFAYAGFLLITSGGESAKKTKAKEIFLNVIIGLAIAVAAWLIIHTLSNLLGYEGSWIGL